MNKKTDLVRVIATRAQAFDYYSLGHYLPNPDPVLKKMGRDISAYREVLSDSHVAGCVRRRKAAVKAMEWRLTPTGNETIDAVLYDILNRLPLAHIISQILNAILYGYQVLEVVWAVEDGRFIPKDVQGKPPEWFIFDAHNTLKMRTKDHYLEGVFLPEKKFLLATQEATYENPYGQGDLAKCFWAATFKKGGFKFWLEFVEKYGSPWLVGKHPRTATPAETEELLDSLAQMLGTAVAAIPDDSSIGLIESASKGGSSQVFDDFLRYCKSEISVAILGQDQTTEADTNHASATAGLTVLEDIKNDDARMVEGVFNTLLSWICALNFNVETLPRFELFEQETVNKYQAERDEMLHRMGVRFSKQYLERTYNFEEGDIELAELNEGQENTALFAEGAHKEEEDDNPPLAQMLSELEEESKGYFSDYFKNAKAELAKCQTLEEFNSKLDALIPKLSFEEYAELFALGSTVAQLCGRASVTESRERKNG